MAMMAMVSTVVNTHCSIAVNSIRAKFEVQSCQSPIGSVAKAVVCNASDPGSSPLQSTRDLFFSRVSFPGKNEFRKLLTQHHLRMRVE